MSADGYHEQKRFLACPAWYIWQHGRLMGQMCRATSVLAELLAQLCWLAVFSIKFWHDWPMQKPTCGSPDAQHYMNAMLQHAFQCQSVCCSSFCKLESKAIEVRTFRCAQAHFVHDSKPGSQSLQCLKINWRQAFNQHRKPTAFKYSMMNSCCETCVWLCCEGAVHNWERHMIVCTVVSEYHSKY